MDFPHCAINDLPGLLWSNVALLSITGIVVVSSFLSQFKDAAPYGRHATPEKEKQWGPPVSQRVAHFCSDAIPGVPFCLAVYLIYSGALPTDEPFSAVRAVNVVLLCGWLLHYAYRGFITPLIMPYSSRTVSLGIPLAGFVPNSIFAYLVAIQLACTEYPSDWAAGPRFIIGVVLYVVGTAINRWADLKLRAGRLEMLRRRQAAAAAAGGAAAGGSGRASKAVAAVAGVGAGAGGEGSAGAGVRESLLDSRDGGGGASAAGAGAPAGPASSPPSSTGSGKDGSAAGGAAASGSGSDVRDRYFIPHGGLYDYIACPNYLGELLEWGGFALGTWSWPALSWLLFCTSTFVPRALTHLRWYRDTFPEYPRNRKALIPFVL